MTNFQTPKSQWEISTGTAKTNNRGTAISRTTDKVKDFTVSIKDIDFAIRYYFQKVIKPRVTENGNNVDVPVIYGNPERWKSILRDGFFKDEKDKVILPIIAFKRNSIAKDDNYSIDKLDANSPLLFYPFKKKWSAKNNYDNFAVSVGIKPTEEYYSVVVPDYVVMTYDFIIVTETVDQMNKIVESILYSEGSYWGDPERFKFRTNIKSYNTSIEASSDTQRTVKTTFNMELNGYLVPDAINKQLPLMASNFTKAFSLKQVVFGFDIDQTNEFFSPSVAPAYSSVVNNQGGMTTVTVEGTVAGGITEYLSTSIPVTAIALTSNSATFPNVNILQGPPDSGITTTKDSFSVFVNGQYIPSTYIISVSDSGTTVVIVFNIGDLGFAIEPTDVVVAIGKFTII